MTLTDPALWARIESYTLPKDAAGISFLEQLRKMHGISHETAQTAIREYKRFLYLSALRMGRCVPTRAVDEVWHLHLTHTRDYWESFVPDVLGGRKIHHEPGAPDGHSRDFDATLHRYEAEFGEVPPKGIWKKRSLPKEVASMVFVTLFGVLWIGQSVLGGAPWYFTGMGLLIFGWIIMGTLGPLLDRAGYEVSFGIDIWSDANGGDCGDCGGGCGD